MSWVVWDGYWLTLFFSLCMISLRNCVRNSTWSPSWCYCQSQAHLNDERWAWVYRPHPVGNWLVKKALIRKKAIVYGIWIYLVCYLLYCCLFVWNFTPFTITELSILLLKTPCWLKWSHINISTVCLIRVFVIKFN